MRNMLINIALLLAAFLFVIILCDPISAFATPKTNAENHVRGIQRPILLTIAASSKNDDNFERGVFLFKIHCVLESCSLERISFNECVEDKNGSPSFTPRVDTWASWAGFLEADLKGNFLGLTIFQATHHTFPAKVELELDFSNAKFVQAKSFKATGFLDSNKWPETGGVIEYVPVVGNQTRKLNCPVFLPGIKSNKNNGMVQ